MQTFSRIKRIIAILIIVGLSAIGLLIYSFALSDLNSSKYFNYDYSQIKKNGEKIDMLILGGSRMYRSFDPEIFEKELGLNNVINDATPTQNPILSYYLLKEVLKYDKPETLIMGVSFDILNGDQSVAHYQYGMDRLHGLNKLACTYQCYGINDGFLTLIKKNEYKENLHIDSIKENVRKKLDAEAGIWSSEGYKHKGYIGAPEGFVNGNVPSDDGRDDKSFREDLINPKYLAYLEKIMDLCKAEGIEVHMVTGMCTTMQVYDINGYQEATDFFTQFAKEHDTEYYNLNYIKNREKNYDDSNFCDFLHLNYKGGQKSSRDYTRVLKKLSSGINPDDMFYENLDEFKKSVNRIPGCQVQGYSEGNVITLQLDSKHNDNVVPQYRLLGSYDDNTVEEKIYVPITDWSSKTTYKLSRMKLHNYTSIKVEARTGMQDEVIASAVKPFKKLRIARKYIVENEEQ